MAGSEPRLHSRFIFRMTGSGLLFRGSCLPVTIIIRKPHKYVNPYKKEFPPQESTRFCSHDSPGGKIAVKNPYLERGKGYGGEGGI